MFSLQIVDSDAFLDMPVSSQVLYFHMAMRADDEGFIGNPKRVMRMMGASDDDYKVLVAKKFLIPFESGVCVIKHWLIHNTIRMDRFGGTTYINEKAQLVLKDNKAYKLIDISHENVATIGQPDGNLLATQVKLSKVKLSKDKGEQSSPTPAQLANDFFCGGETYYKLLEEFSEGNKAEWMELEFKKFTLYWTEPNSTGTKLRWQKQPTFEIKRRLYNWVSKSGQFKGMATQGRGLA